MGERRRRQAKARNQGSHHDGAQAEQVGFMVASRILRPSRRSLLMYETRITAVSTETPIRASSPRTDETLKGVCASFKASKAPTGIHLFTQNGVDKP